MDAVLADASTAPLSDADRALFAFLDRVNSASFALSREQIEEVVRAGCSEEAVYDAITVCALFNFYNRWCDASGVHPMALEDHARGGKRMAQHGYLPPQADAARGPEDGP